MLLKLDGVLRRLVFEFVDVRDGFSVWTVLTKDCSTSAAPTTTEASSLCG